MSFCTFAVKKHENMEIKISRELNVIMNFARDEAMRTGSYGISPDHLFLGIIRHKDNEAARILQALGVDLDEFKQFIDEKIRTDKYIPFSEFEKVSLSRGAYNILSLTILEATRSMTDIVRPEHLLLALCKNMVSGYGQTWLYDRGTDYDRVYGYMESAGILSSGEKNWGSEPGGESGEKEESPVEEPREESALEKFGYDLTKAAEEGKLDPVTGRETEIERVLQILGRRKKNNPMLVGDPGVGKSAIVEGIALKIAGGEAPQMLTGKRIISLDMASLVAGTRYRGDFEKRLKTVINEIGSNPDIILFIDEFHTIVGAGGAGGSLDAANILKPALARGEIHCIGATTMEEFRKIVEKDGALDRRFQKIIISPADTAQTLSILESLHMKYEFHHLVSYSGEALKACVRLSDRYITDRCLPDKAVDVMDEAGSMVRLRNKGKKPGAIPTVTEEDIAAVISTMTGIPIYKVAESERTKLVRMEEKLKKRIVGQDEAIGKVVRAIRRNRAGIKDPGRPIGSFLFAGPTGVGKTQLAKALAEYLFDSEENLVRLDMSEYMDRFTSSKLIGAPPGYVGFDEGGQLSERVRRKPYSVVLLDEIEKAHPDIFNLLLQVLDEGRLTDSNGRTVDFRNTILIMTSNVGSREVDEYGGGLGFTTSSGSLEEKKKGIIEKSVRKLFPPEFLNRIDEQIFFRPLGMEDLEKIVDMELKGLRKRVLDAGYRLSISAAARKTVLEAGYDPAYGARPLKRAIRKYIEDPVSESIISDKARSAGGAGTLRKLCIVTGRNGKGTEAVMKG